MQRYRSHLGLLSALALAASAVATGAAPAGTATAAPHPIVEVYGQAGSPIAAGAHALIDVAVRNNGEADLAAPVTLTVAGLPAGVSLLAAETDLVGRSWECGGSTTCTLTAPDGVTPAILEAFEVAQGRLRFAVDGAAAIPATVDLDISVGAGVSDPPANLDAATTTVTLSRLDPSTPGTMEVVVESTGLVADRMSTTTLTVTNLGPSPMGGNGATIVAEGVLPPGSTDWTSTGTGWSCTDVGGLPTCTWAGAELDAGAAVEPLVLDFRAPATSTTEDGAPLTWTQTVTHTPSSGPAIADSTERVAFVLVGLAPIASVFALPTGLAAVERGSEVRIDVGMAGSGLADRSRDLEITAPLPTGWSFVDANDPWSCVQEGSNLRCVRSADLEGATESSTTVTLATDASAAIGPQSLTFTGVVTGPDAGAATTDDVTIEVAAVGAPLSQLRIFHYPTPDTAVQIIDGTPLSIMPGTPALLGLAVANSGTDDAPAGTELVFSVDLPPGTVASDVGGATAWSCTTASVEPGETLTCTITLATDLAPGVATETVKLSVDLPDAAPTGPHTWPLELAGTFDGQPLTSMALGADLPVVVETAATVAPALGLDVDVLESARVTHPLGLVSVTPANGGAAEMSEGWKFTIHLPEPYTDDDEDSLAKGCKYKKPHPKGKDGKRPEVQCTSDDALAPGASGPTITIPIRVPAVAGPLELAVEGKADGAEHAVVPFTMRVLPELVAEATATPDRVVLPPDPSTLVPDVLLDGRASVSDGATATWTQVVGDGDPMVDFTGFGPGEPAIGLVARFEPPRVTEETTLRFRLLLADAHSSASTEVDVVIEPADAPQPDAAAAASPSQQSSVQRSSAVDSPRGRRTPGAQASSPDYSTAAVSAGSGSWSWTTDPTFSKNDVSPNIDAPIWMSRIRVVHQGAFRWDGPGPNPTGVTLTIEWEECNDLDVDCAIVGTGNSHLVGSPGPFYTAIFTIQGTDGDGLPVTTTERFAFGRSQADYSTSVQLKAPTIIGAPQAGRTLTGGPGEWSLEYDKELAWVTCTGTDVSTCTAVPGEEGDTLVVRPEDEGKPIRFRVSVSHPEAPGVAVGYSSALQSGVTVDCGTDCYTWSVEPEIDHTGIGEPFPVTGFEAVVLDDGAFDWNDPTSPPETVTTEVRWYTCDPDAPTTCRLAWVGRSFIPFRPNELLEARLTATGVHAVDGTHRRGTIVMPFGLVRDSTLPPVATTPPSISGNPLVGQVLTADPGEWEGAPLDNRWYQWLRCDAADPDQCAAVTPLTETSTYEVREEDLTETASVMRVDVLALGYRNLTQATARSAPTDAISANTKRLVTPPAIDAGGGLRVGVEATATFAVWTENPPAVSGPDMEWHRCDSADPSSCQTFAIATGTSYVPNEFDVGRYLRVRSSIGVENATGDVVILFADSTPVGPVEAAPLVAGTDLAGNAASIANGESLTVTGSAEGGVQGYQFAWTQTAGEPVSNTSGNPQVLRFDAPASGASVLGFRLTVTDSRGETASVHISVEYGNTGAPVELCQAHELVRQLSGGLKDLYYGDVQIRFAASNGSVNGDLCNLDTVVTITGAVVLAYDIVSTSMVDVTIDADGVTIEGDSLVSLATGTAIDDVGLELVPGSSLSIPFGDDDGTYELVGAVVGDFLPDLLRVGDIDTGATRLALGSAGGVQSLTLEAVGWDSSFGSASPVPGQLPEPPVGSPVIGFGGTVRTDKTFDLMIETTGIIDIAGATIDFTGTISRATPTAPLELTANGSLAAPVDLARNVVLESASLGWDGDVFTGAGAVTITTDAHALRIDAAFEFADPSRWSAEVAVDSTLLAWEPIPGLTFENPTASGTISRIAGATGFDVAIGADAVTIGAGVLLTSPTLRLAGSCADGNCVYDLDFSTGLELTMFGDPLQAQLTGTLNTGTGAFRASVELDPFAIVEGLSVHRASMVVERGDATGLDIEITAGVSVFGSGGSLTITIDHRGALALVEVGTWTPFAGAPTFEESWLIYSNFSTTIDVGGEDVDVRPAALHFSARTGVPPWFADLIGDDSATAVVSGVIERISPLTFDFSIEFVFDDAEVFSVADVRLVVRGVTFEVKANGTTFSTSLAALAKLHVPATGGGDPSELDVNVGLQFRPDTRTISGYIELENRFGAWNDAFGVDGLQIHHFAISVGLNLVGGVQLGFAGSATLPTAWAKIGILPDTQASLVASISGASSCFGIELSRYAGTHDVIDVANLGVLRARHASLYIAPTGCDVGSVHIDPGIAMSFDGTILDVDVSVELAVSPDPFEVSARIELGTIDLGPLVVENTVAEVDITRANQRLFFAASTTVFDATADVSGEFTRAVGGPTTIAFHGTFTTPDLGGFQLDELTVDFSYTTSPKHLVVKATVDVTVLNQDVMVDLAFEMLNGKVVAASGSADLTLTFDELVIDGTGSFEFAKGQFPTISIEAVATVDGNQLTAVSATLRQGSLEFAAELAPIGIFTAAPQLSGAIFWASSPGTTLPMIENANGVLVRAQPGDFRFQASNIGVRLTGLDLNADVLVGLVGGEFFAQIDAKLNFELSRYSSAAVEFHGSFSSNGTFDIRGDGRMRIGNIDAVTLHFAIVRTTSSISVSAGSTITIPDIGSVAVNGRFSYDATLGWLYELEGELDITVDGHEFGRGEFTSYRVKESNRAATGMSALIAVDVPNLAAGNANAAIYSSGSVSFEASLRTQGLLEEAVGDVSAWVAFESNAFGTEFSFRISVNDVLDIPVAFTLAGGISSNGNFSVDVTVGVGPFEAKSDLVVCTAHASAQASLRVRIVSSPTFEIMVDISGSASAGCGVVNLSADLKGSFEYDPPKIELKVKISVNFGSPIGSWGPTLKV